MSRSHFEPRCCTRLLQGKDAKVAYLTKAIDAVGLALGQHVPVKPLKVRARCAGWSMHGWMGAY
jgi:hypothetical protein